MFDVGFSELLICFIVALVVLGPEKLPAVARSMGRWTGMARSYMRNLSAELERETQTAELRKQLADANKLLHDQTAAVREATAKLTGDLTPPAALPPPAAPADAGDKPAL